MACTWEWLSTVTHAQKIYYLRDFCKLSSFWILESLQKDALKKYFEKVVRMRKFMKYVV